MSATEAQLRQQVDRVLQKPHAVLRYARESVESFFHVLAVLRKQKGKARKKGGAPSHQEQDVLRAALVFAAAGLDSLLKHVIRDVLPVIIQVDQTAEGQLQKFASRALRGRTGRRAQELEPEEADEWFEIDTQFLAAALVSESPRDLVIGHLRDTLVSESLLSTQQLYRVVNYLGLDPAKDVGLDKNKMKRLKEIFDCRNQIVHDMDIDFVRGWRNRVPRNQQTIQDYSRELLEVGDRILQQLSKKLKQATRGNLSKP